MNNSVLRGFAALALSAAISLPLPAQYFGQSPGVLPAYQAPLIALSQPLNGGSVPQDKPVVVFRFSAAEQADPIDARSFAVAVDGEDHTSLFKMTATEAWGPLAPATKLISVGQHQLVARICSTRGACNTASALVNVASGAPASSDADSKSPSKKRQVFDALIGAIRTLIRN